MRDNDVFNYVVIIADVPGYYTKSLSYLSDYGFSLDRIKKAIIDAGSELASDENYGSTFANIKKLDLKKWMKLNDLKNKL